MDPAIQLILQLTPFANIDAVDDYARVRAHLVEYWDWDIEAYRSYLNPNIRADNPRLVLCALVLLTMVEWMHLCYSGLTPEALRERIHAMGPRTFAILAAIPHLGVIIVRNIEIVTVADFPVLACSLIVASMLPALIIPLILSSAQKFKVWVASRWRQQRESEHSETEATTVAVTDRSESRKVVSEQTMIEDVEASLGHNGYFHSSEEGSGFDPMADERI